MRVIRPQVLAAFATIFPIAVVGGRAEIAQSAPARPNQELATQVPADALLAQLNDSMRQVAAAVSPAVVQIEVSGFGTAEEGQERNTAVIVRRHSIGAGMIVASDGYIMTNAHVVAGAKRIRVMLSPTVTDTPARIPAGRGRMLEARLIGVEEAADLALLKVDADNLPALRFNLDHAPQPGELVFAIGSPNGLQNTVTLGVISSAPRQPDPDHPMVYLQTDAPINQGNSGGPLIDVTGAAIGLNTFILSRGGGSEGLGFAIPARIVDYVYQSLRKQGRVDRIEINVVPQVITPTMADGLGLAQDWGVMIADVLPGGLADAAGVKAGDIVEAVDGTPVLSLTEFAAALYQHPPDGFLALDLVRGGERLLIRVACLPARSRLDRFGAVPDPVTNRVDVLGILGLDVDRRICSLMPEIRLDAGVLVLGHARGFDSVESGLLAGDVIHAVNRTPVESVSELKSAVSQLTPGESVVLRIERLGVFHYLAFEME